jgi:D-3-phosphoglycerate dehydrogenase / 2-oxoglutarate reductase
VKFIIIDKVHPILFDLFEKESITYDYLPDFSIDQAKDIIADYDGLIVRNKIVDEGFLKCAEKLKYIGRAGAGLDNIDLVQAQKQHIAVFNAAEANKDSVGEHTLGMLLCLFNKINTSHQKIKNRIWDREGGRGLEIAGKTIAIIGYGNMGTAFAKRLQGFDCKVIYYDIATKDNPFNFVEEATLEQVFEIADVVSLHIPLDHHNKNWVDAAFINRFKKDIYLINVARGEVVETKALIDGLKSGKIAGACLDVLENENLGKMTDLQKNNFEFLTTQDNVILTPHVAGWSVESYRKISEVLFYKFKNVAKNQSN